eukprot:jgi/Antlo1/1862/2301
MKISDMLEEVVARQILDSRGVPAVEVDMHTVIGVFRDSCPSGASTGTMEAKVVLDKEDNYDGKGVSRAIFNIRTIIVPNLASLDVKVSAQDKIDLFLCDLDGTHDKRRLGANAILPMSLAFARAGAVYKNMSLREYVSRIAGTRMKMPQPFFNVINGGMHSGNGLAFQEMMITFCYDTYTENLKQALRFYKRLKQTIAEKYGPLATNVGDEGGFAPPVQSVEEALDLITKTHNGHGFENMRIGIDSAANSFYRDGRYEFNGRTFSSEEFVSFYADLVDKYPLIFSLEDPFSEDDAEAWNSLHARLQGRVRIVGDDLTVTNQKRLQQAIDQRLCDTLLVKINQIGTVSEAIAAVKLARTAGMHVMVSHRSGETEDTFICDFAVGLGAEYIKAGAPCRGERISKYNQLLRMEEAMIREKKK